MMVPQAVGVSALRGGKDDRKLRLQKGKAGSVSAKTG